MDDSSTEFIVARSLVEAQTIADKKYNRPVKLTQDEDVLDTWFRSVVCQSVSQFVCLFVCQCVGD